MSQASHFHLKPLPAGPGVPAETALKPAWIEHAQTLFCERLLHPDYPCFLGAAALKAGDLFYTCVQDHHAVDLPAALATFLAMAANFPKRRCNLTVFFEPEPALREHAHYAQQFWDTLRYLKSRDPAGESQVTDPEDPRWEFSFAGELCFVFGGAPSYSRRRSRNLGPGLVMLIQPRASFFNLDANTYSGDQARLHTRRRMKAWDNMEVHPDLKAYGEPGNREWKQYFLPDDVAPITGRCPMLSARAS